MVNTVVFDIGNVLVDFRWQGLFEDLGFTGDKFERIADATVRSQWWKKLRNVKEKFEAFLIIWTTFFEVEAMRMNGSGN